MTATETIRIGNSNGGSVRTAERRLVFLCKREYMRKDVVADRYARLFEIPYRLSMRNVDVRCVSLSYRPNNQGAVLSEPTGLDWYSFNLFSHRLLNVAALRAWYDAIRSFKPHMLIGASDALHAVLVRWAANRLGIPYALDLYDNFESFGLTRLPGMQRAYSKSISEAEFVSCVSRRLADHVRKTYAPDGEVFTIESTINREDFVPPSKQVCRTRLGLPQELKLIGTAGALRKRRGVATLYTSYAQLAARGDIGLVLAGRGDSETPIPEGSRVFYLGELAHDLIDCLWKSLDVAVICARDSAFGRYSFPQKAYEIAACQVPVIAARVGAMQDLFASYPNAVYKPDDAADLCEKISHQLHNPNPPRLAIPTWDDQAACLYDVLNRLAVFGNDRLSPIA